MKYQLTGSIVLYKNDASVKQAVESFLNASLTTKLYLIDNSPTAELRTMLSEYLKDTNKAEYIFNKNNLGYGAGHNVALRQVLNQSEYHLILNPDVYFEPRILSALYGYASANPSVGQIIPKVLYPDGNIQYVCKLIPTPFNLIARLLPNNLLKNYNEKFELQFSGYNKIMNVPYLSGCFMFLRCAALQKIGLFDERFFMYPEDIDLTRRIHKKFETIFYPYVQIVHQHTKSSFKSGRMFAVHAKNMIRYFNKWGWLFDKERREVNAATLRQFKTNNT